MGVRHKLLTAGTAAMVAAALLVTGCTAKAAAPAATTPAASSSAPKALKKIVFANGGATCEAPVFIGIEKGIFKKYGLDVSTEFYSLDKLQVAIASGKVAGVLGNLEWIKPIEQGIDVKYVAGLHKGCIQAVAPKGSGIKSIADLKGKRIGVNAIADYPHVLIKQALADAGIKDGEYEIKAFPGDQLELALDKKEIDAFIMWDPFPQLVADKGKGEIFFSNTTTKPYADRFCCMVVLSGKLVREDPETAKALRDALFEASAWVQANPQETGRILADKKYVAGDAALQGKQLATYDYTPSVAEGRTSALQLAQDLKKQNFLDAGTDPTALVDKAYAELK